MYGLAETRLLCQGYISEGSVVTKDIPDWSVAVGNPCRVVKKITEEDKQYYFKDRKFDDEAWEVIKDL